MVSRSEAALCGRLQRGPGAYQRVGLRSRGLQRRVHVRVRRRKWSDCNAIDINPLEHLRYMRCSGILYLKVKHSQSAVCAAYSQKLDH